MSSATHPDSFHLRLLDLVDVESLTDYLIRNQTYHAPWSPVPPPEFFTQAYQYQRVAAHLDLRDREIEYRFVILPADGDGEIVGTVNLVNVERSVFLNGRFGYSIDEAWSGRGVMTAALDRAVEFAFGDLGLHRVEANVMPRNYRSRRVLEKCGFRRVGFSPRMLFICGKWEDHEMYARLADDLDG